MQNNISRTETDILKGVAIIMMLWLHLFLTLIPQHYYKLNFLST